LHNDQPIHAADRRDHD